MSDIVVQWFAAVVALLVIAGVALVLTVGPGKVLSEEEEEQEKDSIVVANGVHHPDEGHRQAR